MKERIPDIMDLELLTPGSNWTRENGKVSRFLFLTNSHLPLKVQEVYPQMVVYADEEDNVLSVTVSEFLAKRKFHNVDPALEQRLENLLAYDGADSHEDDTFSLLGDAEDDELQIEDPEDLAQTDLSEVEKSEITANAMTNNNMFPVSYETNNPEQPSLVDLAYLATLTESYSQLPIHGTDQLSHTLFIREVSGVVDADILGRCFNPDNASENSVLNFNVDLGNMSLAIVADKFVGAYPYVFQNQRMVQVIVTTGSFTNDATTPAVDTESEADVDFQVVAENVDGLAIVGDTATANLVPIETIEQALAEAAPVPNVSDTAPAPSTDEGFVVTVE